MLSFLRAESYQGLVGAAFPWQAAEGVTLALTLLEVTPKLDDEVQYAFSLVFGSDETTARPQQLYRLSHPSLGDFDLFLVPIQKRKSGIIYEAVINLLKDEAQ